jgi:hypothetical protein
LQDSISTGGGGEGARTHPKLVVFPAADICARHFFVGRNSVTPRNLLLFDGIVAAAARGAIRFASPNAAACRLSARSGGRDLGAKRARFRGFQSEITASRDETRVRATRGDDPETCDARRGMRASSRRVKGKYLVLHFFDLFQIDGL